MSPGSYAPNLHEGSRSEYLAQYIFSTFGTSLPVLHQEDYGIDLYCTLSERKGHRAVPVAYYSAQIKSTDAPWQFYSADDVKWLVEYPVPLLLCIIDKSKAQIRIYQTLARFGAAVTMQLPDRLTLSPGTAGQGRTLNWDRDGNCELGPPILQFTIADLMNDELYEQYRKVLHFWVLCDQANVWRYQVGMRSVSLPPEYSTNELPPGGRARFFLGYATDEIRAKAEETAFELDEWLAPLMLAAGDRVGALLAALMLRHRDPDYQKGRTAPLVMSLRADGRLDVATSTGSSEYVYAPLDKLLDECRQKING
jgi:hypothetical protein